MKRKKAAPRDDFGGLSWSDMLRRAVDEPGELSKCYCNFHNYSVGNAIAALFQCAARGIEPGPIASYNAWGDKGRQVRAGERGIVLCMPVSRKIERETDAGELETVAFTRFVYRANWFAVSQTDALPGAAAPAAPAPPSPWCRDRALAALDVTLVPFESISGNSQGYAAGREIAINPIAERPHKTTFHELAHIVLGHTEERDYITMTPADRREVQAESVAYLLINTLGMPGDAASRGYIQHWLAGNTIGQRDITAIFSAADKILKAGLAPAGAAAAAPELELTAAAS